MFENFENNYKIWTIIITLFIIPTIVLLNLISKNTINFVKEIELYDDGFMIKFFLFKKNEFIKYNLISNISYHKSYSNAGSGRINDDYFVSTIEFKNNRILNISSNKFENYYEMVNFIKTKV